MRNSNYISKVRDFNTTNSYQVLIENHAKGGSQATRTEAEEVIRQSLIDDY